MECKLADPPYSSHFPWYILASYLYTRMFLFVKPKGKKRKEEKKKILENGHPVFLGSYGL